MRRSAIKFTSAIALSAALAACGTSTTSSSGNSSPASSPAAASTGGEPGQAASSESPSPTESTSSDSPSSTESSPSAPSSSSSMGEGGPNPNGVPSTFLSPDASSKPDPKQILSGSKTVVGDYSKDILKSVKIERIGAQRSWAGTYLGESYAILEVTGTKPAMAETNFEFLDKSGKVVGTSEWSFKVGKGTDMLKILGRTSEIPYAATSVRIHITRVSSASTFDDMNLRKVRTDGVNEFDGPQVTGQYKPNNPDAFVTSFTAVCWDDKGNTYSSSAAVPKDHATDWTDFKVDFLNTPKGWKAKSCAVGQS